MDPRAEYIQKILDLNQRLVLGCIDGVSQEHFNAPRDGGNSMQWIFGHLTGSRVLMARMLGAELEFPYRELFRRGAVRGAAAQLPGAAEMTSRWNAACGAVSEGLATAPAEVFGRAVAAEGPPSADGTVLGCIAFMTMHDSYHLGQLGWLRKAFGYPTLAG
jgi:hypothetical protein